MIKINIVQDFVNPNEELTKDKCLERIRSIKSTIRQTRSNVYGLFLGFAALKYASFLLLGSIALAWMKGENTMITCCSDGTRPVIFKIERIDYE